MEHLEPRVVMANYVVPGTLGPDVFLLRRDPTTPTLAQVQVGGTTLLDVPVVAGDSITLNPLDGDNTVNIEDTFPGVSVTVNDGINNGTVNISPTARFLDNIDGPVIVNGGPGGVDTLNIFDQNDPFNDIYAETSSSVGRSYSATISDSAIDAVNVFSGTGDVTHRVESNAAGVTTTLWESSGNDTVTVSSAARNFGTIGGTLAVNGAAGTNSLRIEDQAGPAGSTYTVTGSSLARTSSGTVKYTAMGGGVIIDGGPGAATYNVVGTSAGNPVVINAGNGNNTFNVSPTTRNLDLIKGNLSLSAGAGVNQVVVNDQNNPNNDAWTLTTATVSRTNSATITLLSAGMTRTVNAGPGNNIVNVLSTPASGSLVFNAGGGVNTLVGPNSVNTFDITGVNSGSLNLLRFSSVQNLQGNALADTVKFEPAGSISGAVDGRGSTNTLDFSARTTPVSVNLLTDTSTSIGVVLNFQNVFGGAGDDTIIGSALANNLQGNGGNDIEVGDGGNDVIGGGAGNDVEIGGLGLDTLDGGAGDDLIVGGTTLYDANTAALQAIMNEWASANTYATRVNTIRIGGGLVGPNILRATAPGQTVFDDGVTDTETGDGGNDWYFTAAPDPFPVLDPGEQVN
jgi:hypothetical protein